jgi:hypothetical protein
MKKLFWLVVIVSAITWGIIFYRALQSGSDGAWMFLGVIGTLMIYIVFSAVDLVKDRQRARWHQADLQNGSMRAAFEEMHQVSRAQGQFLINQQKMARLAPPDNDLLVYDDALAGEVLEYDGG